MDRAKKSRKVVRARVTKLCTSVDNEVATQVPFKDVLKDLLAQLKQMQEKLAIEDDKVKDVMLDEDKPDEELEAEMDKCAEYQTKIRKYIISVEKWIKPKIRTPEVMNSVDVKKEESNSLRLSKLDPPKFSGELKDWLGWWSQFERIDKDPKLHDSDKFRYLIKATEENTKPREMINVFPPTGENYKKALETLKSRYGREGIQLQFYLRELLKLVLSKGKIPLDDLYYKLEAQLQALETLDLSKADPSMYFYPLVESSLPEEVLRTWIRNQTKDSPDGDIKGTLKELRGFLKTEVEGNQRIDLAQNFMEEESKKNSSKGVKKKQNDFPTAQSLYVKTDSSCLFCKKTNHRSQDCFRAQKMSNEERTKKIREEGACYRCLKKGHMSRNCDAKVQCKDCKGSHYLLMCREAAAAESGNESGMSKKMQSLKMTSEESTTTSCHSTSKGLVLLRTVRVILLSADRKRKYNARLLFDDGSNRSYIKTATAEKLNCKILDEFELKTTVFGGSTMKRKKKWFSVLITNCDNTFNEELALINEDNICGDCPTVPNGPWMKELTAKNIFINDTMKDKTDIEILIGCDLGPKLMTGRMFKTMCGLMAVESVFGWSVCGEIESQKATSSYASSAISMLTQGERTLPELWDLDTIGIKDSAEQETAEEHNEKVKETFKKEISRSSDGRYVVKLPWVDKNIPLPSNKVICVKRLETLTKKLKNENLYETYDSIFKGWEQEGLIERISNNQEDGHYLPHHRVLKPESKTTPVRPVYNASFKVGNNPSLNDCLEPGPNLLELIPSILLRFREKNVGVISDVRKAFQMIQVDDRDKNYQKFLWWEDKESDKIVEFRHCRVVFGFNCSPFMLAAVLEYHFDTIEDEEEKSVVKKLQSSLYVDNCVISLDSENDYKKFKRISIKILSDAKMDLRQWESSCEKNNGEETMVLGLAWNKHEDFLRCKIKPQDIGGQTINKRSILSLLSQIYDPIGFTAPATLQGKLMLQACWAKELSWDEEWSKEDQDGFRSWYAEISELSMIQIPRIAIGSNPEEVQLHLFTDASQDAFAAVVYARVKRNGAVSVQLLLSKSRLAPLPKINKKAKIKKEAKKITIPRLELLGCVIGARLLNSVVKSLDYHEKKIICWSDSTTALSWIRREEDWGTFVGRRVKEINQLIGKNAWRHVPGELNPADLPSRGCTPYELRQSRWWEGPNWLYDEEAKWPQSQEKVDEVLVQEEKRKSVAIVNSSHGFEIRQYSKSSYLKNVRAAAWTRRFIQNLRVGKDDRVMTPDLSIQEIKDGERDLLRGIQQQYYPNGKPPKGLQTKLGEDGLYHIETRLTYREDSELFKNPIVLPSQEPIVQQLIEFYHKAYCHAGAQFVLNKLRERYWITSGRMTVNKVIRKCVICKRYSGRSLPCDPAPLPLKRVETQCAFQTTGVDLAGPFYLKGGKKAWGVIYTCAVYRGVHLDIVDSLSSEEFLNSLHKFSCIVGRPSTTFSDNGTNFVGAESLMKKIDWKKVEEQFQVKRIVWKFNPPTAAWWGGWWERLIRTLKDLLKRMIRTAKLTRKELETCFAEISHVMNNRPLTALTEDENDLIPLTPWMFMRDLPISGLPELEKMTSKDLQGAFHKLNSIKSALKSRFRKEYLGNLIQRKSEKKTPDPKIGDIVLVGADNRKRFEWPLGRIIELCPGRDNKIRVAKVRTARGTLTRPLQRLYPLELVTTEEMHIPVSASESAKLSESEMNRDSAQETVSEESTEPLKTRSGRIINKPPRFGQWSN